MVRRAYRKPHSTRLVLLHLKWLFFPSAVISTEGNFIELLKMFVGFMRHRLKGAGHFVKMVHNGIEYAVMHLLAELHGFR